MLWLLHLEHRRNPGCFGFLAPYLILKKIMGGLQETYQLNSDNTNIWAKMPGNQDISYQKTFQFFNVSAEKYYQIDKVKLIPAYNLTINKRTEMNDLKFTDERVEAVMNQTHIIPDDYSGQDILSRPLLQYRHGAFRAISEIEKRPPT